jgi:hypothetical protein
VCIPRKSSFNSPIFGHDEQTLVGSLSQSISATHRRLHIIAAQGDNSPPRWRGSALPPTVSFATGGNEGPLWVKGGWRQTCPFCQERLSARTAAVDRDHQQCVLRRGARA